MRSLEVSVPIALAFLSVAAQPPQSQSTCACTQPPAECRCEPDQIATCVPQRDRCSTRCRNSTNTTETELVVQVLTDITGLPARATGFDERGQIVQETAARASLNMLREMLDEGRRGPVTYEARIPPIVRSPDIAGDVRLGMQESVAQKLRAGLKRLPN